MDLISAFRTFLRVAETRSFSGAAQDRNLTQPAVSRQVLALEQHLDIRLLHRTTNGISLTAEGHRVIPLAMRLLETAEELHDTIRGEACRAIGKVRLAVPAPLGLYLSSHIGRLLERHPGLSVELIFREGASDLVGEGLDIEVRLGEAPDSSLICRRLGTTTAYLVASPSYLARRPAPTCPEEICGHECISYARAGDGNVWRFSGGGDVIAVRINARLQATNAVAVHHAALAGAGMAILSHILAVADIEAGRLVHVLPDFPPQRLPIFAYYPSRQNVPLRVKTVLDFLSEVVSEDDAMREHPAC